MSLVLSIYSQKGFREITLPERGQNDLQILIQKDLFGLERDIRLDMERSEDVWTMLPQDGAAFISPEGSYSDSSEIRSGMNLEIGKKNGDKIAVIAYEQVNPITDFRKFSLAGIKKITIGRNESNDICYQDDFVSGSHCVISLENGRTVLNDTSMNGTYLNFRRVFGSTILNYGDSIRVMRLNIIFLGDMIAVNGCDNLQINLQPLDAAGIAHLSSVPEGPGSVKVLYHRSPRNLRKLHTEPFEIEAPPEQQPLQEQPMSMLVGPALTMAIPMMLGSMLSVVASRASGASANAFMYMGMVTAIASALIGAVWAIVNVRYARKQHKKAMNQRFERYSEYLIKMRDRIQLAYNDNTEALKQRYISGEECCLIDENSPILWNRNTSYEDFLSVRLGIGDVPFQSSIVVPKERFTMYDDSLADKPSVIRDNFQTLKEVPVTVDLQRQRLIGIAGGENRSGAIPIAKAMIAQLASADCYTDVKIAVVYDEANDVDRGAWDFALWLPHVWSSDKKIRYVATDQAERGEVFYALTQILRNRSEEEDDKTPDLKPRLILFVMNPALLDGEAISKYVFARSRDLGLTTVILADRPDDLPNECECVVECDKEYKGIFNTREGRDYGTQLQFDRVSDESLWKLSKTLGRIEVVEAGQDGEIPSAVTFFDMYGIDRPQELNAADRWKKSNSIATMKALVGVKSGNVPCYLDINEKYHGPHGLVAGTTGSGKSETLQTYILSLAVNFSPEDIGFFIIDYKGGGMANLFDGLPHMIGSISNLSGNQVNRAMVSIQSENRRRQRVFAEYGVNNINGYTALYKNGDATEPIPHLFIIIDEFAELKREEPEFMKELISVAQVGRSLGVHLILSTQRPSGTVDENIWANSKFRLCLRVQDRQDSVDMLHRPEAAYLTQAGRCYLQVGNDEIFELFQSGWSGASYDEELGGGNLLIAQMLNATGKVDLAGNHVKFKRKEELKRRWVKQLVEALRGAEQETGLSITEHGKELMQRNAFVEAVYDGIQRYQPDFEQNQFNTSRLSDLCAACAAVEDTGDPDAYTDNVIRMVAKMGGRLPEVKGKTQLEVIVDYLAGVSHALGLGNMRKLWLPVLPEFLYLDALEPFKRTSFDGVAWPEKPKRFQLSALIGMADDPENQAQFPISLDFAGGGHHLLTGTVSTGKSTFLQTVIYSLAATYTPDILNIYCLDFSSKMLSVFGDLKHVGGYLDESDLDNDQIGKFFTMITRILDERKQRFAGTNFEDYVNHNGWTIPAILIVIDNYGGFHEKTGETYEAIMMRLAKEGIGNGIFLMVTAGGISMQELPSRMAENFRTGLSLELQDAFAYSDVLHVVRPSVLPESRVKGRGIMYHEDRILEFQTALAEHAEGGPERNDLIKEAVNRMNAAWTGVRARAVPRIPEKPVREEFTALADYQEALQDPHILPIGYDFEDADVYSFDLVKDYAFLVTGTKASGKTNFLESLMYTCAQRGDDVRVIEVGDSQLAKVSEELGVERCTDGQSMLELFTYIQEEMVRRAPIKKKHLEAKSSDEELFNEALENRRIDIFIGNMQTVINELQDPESPAYDAQSLFDTLCERGKGYNIFIFGEIQDRDQEELMGYACIDSIRGSQAGIRFGGKFSEQKLFTFENIRYQDQERSMKVGIGVIPSEDSEERLIRVVIPLA